MSFKKILREDSIKQIFNSLNCLANDLDCMILDKNDQTIIKNAWEYTENNRKQSKCTSENNKKRIKLIENYQSSRDSTSPTMEGD